MSKQHSLASKARWASITPEDRSKIMRKKITSRWEKATPEQRAEAARIMLAGRKKK